MDFKKLMAMCRNNGGGVVFTPALYAKLYWGYTIIRSMYIDVNGELHICDRPNDSYDRSPYWDDLDAPTQREFFIAINENNVYDKNLF